ncbi:thioesterase family protein [Acuticoccus sp. M5D2P5]|uniref:hotdog domain-containing protein n=1 Tax=Acuticoccus kalidii TaxID=2910977 RepID=UPI001F3E7868|nr:hotdog domain-containing protein [Acuticoccus kalidii]MCF3933499.1 thioesterase family protein [Acuticoccus kalidii]
MSFRFDIRLYFEDTDFTGRVYHGAYVRFLERGRTEWLRVAGIDHAELANRTPPLFFTLRSLSLTFHAPAMIDDLITVVSTSAGERRVAFLVEQTVWRGETKLVTGMAELCLIDPAGRPMRPPQGVRDALS